MCEWFPQDWGWGLDGALKFYFESGSWVLEDLLTLHLSPHHHWSPELESGVGSWIGRGGEQNWKASTPLPTSLCLRWELCGL